MMLITTIARLIHNTYMRLSHEREFNYDRMNLQIRKKRHFRIKFKESEVMTKIEIQIFSDVDKLSSQFSETCMSL